MFFPAQLPNNSLQAFFCRNSFVCSALFFSFCFLLLGMMESVKYEVWKNDLGYVQTFSHTKTQKFTKKIKWILLFVFKKII